MKTNKRREGKKRETHSVLNALGLKVRRIPYPPAKIITDKEYFNRVCKVFKKDVVQVRRNIKSLAPLLSEEEKRSLLL